jgi:ribonuclease P protein component
VLSVEKNMAISRGKYALHTLHPQVWTVLPREATLASVRAALVPQNGPRLCTEKAVENHLSSLAILAVAPPEKRAVLVPSFDCETDLPAQRAQAEAPAWFPREDVHARGPRDSEAPPRPRPQAPLGLSSLDARVQRRHRLSRSRDFDAVYRHGRSVSTRYLVLYWFAREGSVEGARLGLAVPKSIGPAVVRNKMKRRLRELFRSRAESCRRTRTTCSSCGRARRGGRGSRLRLARGARRRDPREGGRVR